MVLVIGNPAIDRPVGSAGKTTTGLIGFKIDGPMYAQYAPIKINARTSQRLTGIRFFACS
jgi:hypothetical protein